MSNPTPPGWYADPANPATEHWWDGNQYVQSRPSQALALQPQYPGAAVGYAPAYGGPVSPKSRTVAAILGFFLGGIGVHRFYLGNIGMGVAMLFLGWLTLGIWPLIDWIMVLAGAAHDGDNLPVVNWS